MASSTIEPTRAGGAPGCPFADRCPLVIDACRAAPVAPVPVGPAHEARCLRTEATAG